MVKRFFGFDGCAAFARSGRLLAIAAVLAGSGAQGQLFGHHDKSKADTPSAEPPKSKHPASQPAIFTIPVEPLGFFAPGAIYQGQRESLVSLDFLDEDHLLFTFHAPGLIHREGRPSADGERQIRAVVLALPSGTLSAEGLWTVHDRGRYLWMLNDGHFLLRDQNNLQTGDASLELKPKLLFQGPLLWLELDPLQDLMATDSREASTKPQADTVPSPATASASITSDGGQQSGQPDIVLRIVRRATGEVMLVSHTRSTVHLPINAEGFVESLRGKGHEWVLNLNYFRGGNRIIGNLDSMCAPSVEFVSNPEVVVTTCNPDNSRWMVAMSIDGKRFWNVAKPPTQIWPRLIMAPNGLRFARETLTVTHPIDTFAPLSFDDVTGQLVEVYDAVSGKVELTAAASPILDGGGNVAISPTARRVAILDGGAIQVYELPAPVAGLPVVR
jgi:hypothetical protein